MLLIAFDIFCGLLAVAFVFTQILIPLVSDLPLFPWFRSSPEKEVLETQEDSLKKANEMADIQNRLDSLQNKVSSKLKSEKK